jgi:hypothetical protein
LASFWHAARRPLLCIFNALLKHASWAKKPLYSHFARGSRTNERNIMQAIFADTARNTRGDALKGAYLKMVLI